MNEAGDRNGPGAPGDRQDEEPRIDFSALDPCAGEADFARVLMRIRTAATPELMRRQEAARGAGRGLAVLGEVARWRRWVLAAAAALAVASAAVLATIHPASTAHDAGDSFVEAIGVPEEWARWLEAGETPGPADLLDTQERSRAR